jgi:hypothetical protein
MSWAKREEITSEFDPNSGEIGSITEQEINGHLISKIYF